MATGSIGLPLHWDNQCRIDLKGVLLGSMSIRFSFIPADKTKMMTICSAFSQVLVKSMNVD